jgi:hypothetical protein
VPPNASLATCTWNGSLTYAAGDWVVIQMSITGGSSGGYLWEPTWKMTFSG